MYTNYVTGHEVGDGPSSLLTRLWRFEGPKKFEWMTNLHIVLHGNQCVIFDGLPDFVSSPSKRGGSNHLMQN